MKRILKSIVAALLLAQICARAQTLQTNLPVSLEQISQAMAKVQTVFTKFVQKRHLSLFKEPLRSEGYLCFQKPGCIRWETTAPYKSILVSNGSGVAQFEWTDGKWQKLHLGLSDALQNVVSQIAGVMDGHYANDRHAYAVSVTNSTNGYIITLVPKNETVRKMMAAIEVYLAPDLKATRRVVLRETDGDYTDIEFTEQVVNFKPPPKTFDLNVPVNIKKIEAVANPKP